MSITFAGERLVWHGFHELTVPMLHDVYRLRSQVFVVEQNCAYGDIDGLDPQALHLLATNDSHAGLAGYLRVLPPTSGSMVIIGRVVTSREARGTGLGRRLMNAALSEVNLRFPGFAIDLAAQAQLERFYSSFGFVRITPDYLDDGILHCDMRLSPS